MVEELVSHEWCRTDLKNKNNQTPLDVVCTRSKKDPDEKELVEPLKLYNLIKNSPNKKYYFDCHRSLKKTITSLLAKKYFVPLYRVHDNAFQAKVLRPVTSSSLLNRDDESRLQLTPSKQLTPAKLRGSPVVAAVVGPFNNRVDADECYDKWVSPNRRLKPAGYF